jgi:tetratricopeptide (TPR) repeat protein
MIMQSRTARAASLALVLAVGVAAAGCGRYSLANLKAQAAFKDANALYQQQDWAKAAARYEDALSQNPDLVTAYFFLGNSYDNLYRAARQGEPDNDAHIEKAIHNYRIAAERETDPKMRKLALEYMVAAYGPDKLNDPSQAEPIVQRMIEMEPKEPTNYFALSKIYEDAGRYEEAEEMLLKAREVRPNDPAVFAAISGFYNRQGDFPRTIEALEQAAALEPSNPEGYQRVAVFYWEKAFRDHRLSGKEKLQYITRGIEFTDRALELNPEYAEALTYKNILLRLQANETTDRARQAALIKEADELRNRAMEINKKRQAGVS